MAGHLVYYYLKEQGLYELYNVTYRTKLTEDSIVLDVCNKDKVHGVIQKISPDVIVNCIGILIRGAISNPSNAIYVNSYFPHFLAQEADSVNSKLIHISTDCVFSGKKGSYVDSDFRDADDIYGRSKALGEIRNDKDLTIRTSIIGPELKRNGEGLFHWFMTQKGLVSGYKTAFWSGVTTLELAKMINWVIQKDFNLSGLIQLSNNKCISKNDLLLLINRIWRRKNLEVQPVMKNGIDKSFLKSESLSYVVPTYETMLLDQHVWMTKHSYLYSKIYNE